MLIVIFDQSQMQRRQDVCGSGGTWTRWSDQTRGSPVMQPLQGCTLLRLRDTRPAPCRARCSDTRRGSADAGPQKGPIGPDVSGRTTRRPQPVRSVPNQINDQWKGDTPTLWGLSTENIFPQSGRRGGVCSLAAESRPTPVDRREKNEYHVDRAYSRSCVGCSNMGAK
jgi:hypothetical protein